jgi:hypothetical protein
MYALTARCLISSKAATRSGEQLTDCVQQLPSGLLACAMRVLQDVPRDVGLRAFRPGEGVPPVDKNTAEGTRRSPGSTARTHRRVRQRRKWRPAPSGALDGLSLKHRVALLQIRTGTETPSDRRGLGKILYLR